MEIIEDRHGRRRNLLPGEILQDGDKLVVAMRFMDGVPLTFTLHDGLGGLAGQKPGYAFTDEATALLSDAVRVTVQTAHESKLTNSWRTPGATKPATHDQSARLNDRDRDAAYAARNAKLKDSWRQVA